MKPEDQDKMISSIVTCVTALDEPVPGKRLELLKALVNQKPLTAEEETFLAASFTHPPVLNSDEAAQVIRKLAQDHGLTLLYCIPSEKAVDFIRFKKPNSRYNIN